MECKVTARKSHYGKEGPWELPEGWEWSTLGAICSKVVDGDHNPPPSEPTPTKYLMISSKNILDNCLDELKEVRYLSRLDFEECSKRTRLERGDILLTTVGTLGRSCIYDGNRNIVLQRSVSVLTTLISNDYVKCFLDSGYFQHYIDNNARGTAQKGFYLNLLEATYLPIPPLNEQQMIVTKASSLLSELERIDNEKGVLHNRVFKAKNKILDLAIHGKLVPQDPTDEPAIKLLKRINPDYIPSHNLHYDEPWPIGWTVTPLHGICNAINGLWKGTKSPLINVGVIRNANFTKDFTLDYSKIEFIDVEQKSFEKRNLEDGDIIVEKSGGSDNFPVGRSILYRGENGKYSFSNFTMSLRITKKDCIIPEYLNYVLQYRYRRGDMRQLQTQTTGLHNLLIDKFMSLSIPVPPVAEQKRIVQAVKSLFGLVNGIRDLASDGKQGLNLV